MKRVTFNYLFSLNRWLLLPSLLVVNFENCVDVSLGFLCFSCWISFGKKQYYEKKEVKHEDSRSKSGN